MKLSKTLHKDFFNFYRRHGVIGSYSTNSDQQRQVGYGVSMQRVNDKIDNQGIKIKANNFSNENMFAQFDILKFNFEGEIDFLNSNFAN